MFAKMGKHLVPLLVALYGGGFLAGFNENLVNMALLSIMAEFGVDSIAAQWLVTGYMIVATIVVTAMAFLFLRVKLRTLFTAASVLSLVGSALGLVAVNFPMLLVARLVQAIGTGIFIPLMMNALLIVVPKRRLGTYMSIGSCMISFGPAFAPVVCGSLVTTFGWRSVFAVPAVGMAVLTVLGLLCVRNLENKEAHLDVPSLALSAVALFTMSYGLALLSAAPVQAGVSLAVFAVATVAFIVRQLRCEHPLIGLTPMKRITFWPVTFLLIVSMMSTFSLSMLLPQYLEGALGQTAQFAGVAMLVPVLVNVVVTLFGGRIFDRFGEWPLIPIGVTMVIAGFALLSAFAPRMELAWMLVGATLTYAGVGFTFSPSQTAGLRTLPPEENAFGVSLCSTFVQVAACIGPSLFTGVMAGVQGSAEAGGASAQLAVAEGFSAAVLVAACIAAAGLVVAVLYSLAARRRAARETAAVR